ncbi:RNA recognition motif [Mactra antiquata]
MSDVDKTLWVGNLPEVSEEILYELFLQAGPLENVSIAKEKDGRQKSFAFVKFSHIESVPYTIKVMEGTQLFGRNLKLQTRPGSIHQQQQQQQQQQQHQQHQQGVVQGQVGNTMNPYQNNPVQQIPNPYMNMQNFQLNIVPQNPYMVSQPVMNPSSNPAFHRSHTWHGSDLSRNIGDRDHDKDRDRDKDRGRENHSRDRSRDTHSRDRSHGSSDRGYRNSPNSNNDRRSKEESFESRRQKVLHKQEQVLQTYRHSRDRHAGGSSYQHQRRGRY